MSARVDLPITGMTCASCATRVERRLNRLDGVTATVNYATERATVEFDPEAVAPEQLVEAVEAAGYEAALPAAGDPHATEAESEGDLAFLHVHPNEGEVAFETDLEPDTRYRLYLQFQHEGTVHTAEFTR